MQLVAISVDPPARGREVRRRLQVDFPLLSDEHFAAMQAYGTRSPEYQNKLGINVNTPTLILVDARGVIRWIHQAADYSVRPTPQYDLGAMRRALGQ